MAQDLLDHRPLEDGRDDFELPGAAVWAVLHVDVEDALEKPRPADAVRPSLDRLDFALGGHVDDRDAGGTRIFSRDCPEFGVALPDGRTLWVLVNHLKSKGYGSPAATAARRKLQAERVKAIYDGLVVQGETLVAVVGDFNDTPNSAALAPLLQGTDLKDVFGHPAFDNGGHPGTYGSCTASNKIDFLLLSPALFGVVQGGGVWRKGMWPGTQPAKWPVYDTVVKPGQAASDHAAVWVDLAL